MEPKNLIKESLFSKGELFLDNKQYIGPYNVKADGSYYTLAIYIDGKSKELKTRKVSLYQQLLTKTGGVDVSKMNGQVVGNTIVPSQEEYDKGFYTRHFIKTKGTKNIAEVTELDFGKIGSKISDILYVGFQLDWKITGPLNDVFDSDGVRQESGVRDTNRRTLERLEQEYVGILDKLQNFTQFYRNF
jgi:hypothetical protein